MCVFPDLFDIASSEVAASLLCRCFFELRRWPKALTESVVIELGLPFLTVLVDLVAVEKRCCVIGPFFVSAVRQALPRISV